MNNYTWDGMSGDWAAGPRVSHDLIVEPGRICGDVGRGWAAGLCNFPPYSRAWLENGCGCSMVSMRTEKSAVQCFTI